MRVAETCSVPGTLAGVQQAIEAFERFSRARALPPDAVWRVLVALDEMLSNIVRHGGGPAEALIDVSFGTEQGGVEVEIVDAARPFNPFLVAAPDTGSALQDRPAGGLGIALVRQLMDEVRYDRRDGRNHVILACRPRPGAPGASPSVKGNPNADR